MALEHEAEALAAQLEQERAQRAKVLAGLFGKRDAIAAFRRLFLSGNDVTADGAAVLADLSNFAQLGRTNPSWKPATDVELREREAMRRVVMHIISRLDLNGSQLRELAKKVREKEK